MMKKVDANTTKEEEMNANTKTEEQTKSYN